LPPSIKKALISYSSDWNPRGALHFSKRPSRE
jgi:hypothetical protein